MNAASERLKAKLAYEQRRRERALLERSFAVASTPGQTDIDGATAASGGGLGNEYADAERDADRGKKPLHDVIYDEVSACAAFLVCVCALDVHVNVRLTVCT
jgi:hypothetical protein